MNSAAAMPVEAGQFGVLSAIINLPIVEKPVPRPVLAVVRPGSMIEQWRVLQACVAAGVIVIPQAANTGLTGGSTPHGGYDRPVVIINTREMGNEGSELRYEKTHSNIVEVKARDGFTLDAIGRRPRLDHAGDLVGLQRRGFPEEDIRAIKFAYKKLFLKKDGNLANAISSLRRNSWSDRPLRAARAASSSGRPSLSDTNATYCPSREMAAACSLPSKSLST